MKQRLKSKKFQEHISQAQLFYNSQTLPERKHLQAALAFELDHCDDPTVFDSVCQRLADIDFELATSVAEMVGTKMPSKSKITNAGYTSAALSQTYFTPKTPTIETRRIAILIPEGYDSAVYETVKGALETARAFVFTIGPKRSKVTSDKSTTVTPEHHLEGQRSTLFDSIFVCPSGASAHPFSSNGRALQWIVEAFGHCKAIGAVGNAANVARTAIGLPKIEIAEGRNEVKDCYGVVTATSIPTGKQNISIKQNAKDFLGLYAFGISQHRNFQREMDGLTDMVPY